MCTLCVSEFGYSTSAAQIDRVIDQIMTVRLDGVDVDQFLVPTLIEILENRGLSELAHKILKKYLKNMLQHILSFMRLFKS